LQTATSVLEITEIGEEEVEPVEVVTELLRQVTTVEDETAKTTTTKTKLTQKTEKIKVSRKKVFTEKAFFLLNTVCFSFFSQITHFCILHFVTSFNQHFFYIHLNTLLFKTNLYILNNFSKPTKHFIKSKQSA
jgi:hypothetical protein